MLIKMHNKKLLKFIFIFNLFYTKYDQKLISINLINFLKIKIKYYKNIKFFQYSQ